MVQLIGLVGYGVCLAIGFSIGRWIVDKFSQLWKILAKLSSAAAYRVLKAVCTIRYRMSGAEFEAFARDVSVGAVS